MSVFCKVILHKLFIQYHFRPAPPEWFTFKKTSVNPFAIILNHLFRFVNCFKELFFRFFIPVSHISFLKLSAGEFFPIYFIFGLLFRFRATFGSASKALSRATENSPKQNPSAEKRVNQKNTIFAKQSVFRRAEKVTYI